MEDIKRTDWKLVVTRNEALLFRSITDSGYSSFQESTGIPWKPDRILRLNEGELYLSQDELHQLREFLTSQEIEFFREFRHRLVQAVAGLDTVAENIRRTDLSGYSPENLLILAKDYFKAAGKAHHFLLPVPFIDAVLLNKMMVLSATASEEEKEELMRQMSIPAQENVHQQEERSLQNLIRLKDAVEFSTVLDKHLKDFGWIGARGYNWSNAWTQKDILQRMNMKGELPDSTSLPLLTIKERERQELLNLAREYAYLRTWRTDGMYRAGYTAKNLFQTIAERAGIALDDVRFLTKDEIIETARQGSLPFSMKELQQRKEHYALYTKDGRTHVLSGEVWKEKMRKQFGKEYSNTQEVQGRTASHGMATGKVSVVLTVEDLPKVQKGDILVSVMTFPHFIPAMEKAAAFVTDEGGFTCHAAIIAREFNIPCIVGTENATKVFKDGDVVEVDATRGVVKKVEEHTK